MALAEQMDFLAPEEPLKKKVILSASPQVSIEVKTTEEGIGDSKALQREELRDRFSENKDCGRCHLPFGTNINCDSCQVYLKKAFTDAGLI